MFRCFLLFSLSPAAAPYLALVIFILSIFSDDMLECCFFYCFIRNCGDMGSGTCGGPDESILFGWAKDAPALALPKGLHCYAML